MDNKEKGLELCARVIGMLYDCCRDSEIMKKGERTTYHLSMLAYSVLRDYGFSDEEVEYVAGNAVNNGEHALGDLYRLCDLYAEEQREKAEMNHG